MTLCSDWITEQELEACCAGGGDAASAQAASEILFELSGRRFVGTCSTTARPCRTRCGCPWQILSRGHIVFNPNLLYPYGSWWCGGDSCGCRPLSRVLLSGNVREVIEVKIDGEVVEPDTYRVDQNRWLVRVREFADDQFNVWPGCQAMDLPDTEDGTFSVTYTFGQDVPQAGKNAAIELACEIFKACAGEQCNLPKGVTRVVRQGVTIEKPAFISWGFEKGGRSIPRGWNTGMPMVDAFLNAYNPTGILRAPIFWSPATEGRYAPTLGAQISGS